MLNRVKREVDIEERPVQVPERRALEVQDRLDRRLLEPRELVERQEQLTTVQLPDALCRIEATGSQGLLRE